MGTLPTSREQTFAGNVTVPASILNALQDCIIGNKVAEHWEWCAIGRGWVETNIAFDVGGSIGHGFANASGGTGLLSGAWRFMLPVGTLVTGIRAKMLGTAAGSYALTLHETDLAGSSSGVATISGGSLSAAWQTVENLSITPFTITEGKSYFGVASIPVNYAIGAVGLRISRL